MKKPTLANAKRMIKKANPEIRNLTVSWDHKPTLCEFKGAVGHFWSSVVNVSADKYRTKKMVFSIDAEGSWIR